MKTWSAPEMVGSIDDLLIEFFQRIPLKPLVQLKLVSKRWNSLISDPKLHSNKKPVGFIFQIQDLINDEHLRQKPYVLSLDRSSPVGPPSIKELYIAKRYQMENKIFHSCNGLFVGHLFEYAADSDYESSQNYNDETNDYFVYNPTTMKYKSIPIPRRWFRSVRWMYLAFDPSTSTHYKIICVLSSRWTVQCKFAIYSSETRSWEKYDNRFSFEFSFEEGVYWNGSIHWISLSKTVSCVYFSPPDHGGIVVDDDEYESDDDEEEEDCGHHISILEMPMPPILENKENKSNNYFGESGDHLNFISYYGSDECYKFKVYEMRRDYSEWFVTYSVDVSNVWNEGLGCPSSFAVCGLVRCKKGDEDDSFLVLLIKRRVVVYNVVDGTFEIVSEFDMDDCEDDGYDIFRAFKSYFKHPMGLRMDCPLQYFESLCEV